MIGEILTGILGVGFLTGAVMQFRCKGPIWSTEYIASTPKERKKLRTRQEYYWTAIACLWIGLLFLLTLIYTLTEIKGFLYAVFVLSAFLFLHILYGIYRAAKKSTMREPKDKE
ncbi:MAG: hypothetical protein Q4D16_17640 [Eubacteriales bacterium]|nr:hypothetical protein [Eubacteriales bacterium]